MVSIWKFRILGSNQIEYWSNYSIRFEILNIRTALFDTAGWVIRPFQISSLKYVFCVMLNLIKPLAIGSGADGRCLYVRQCLRVLGSCHQPIAALWWRASSSSTCVSARRPATSPPGSTRVSQSQWLAALPVLLPGFVAPSVRWLWSEFWDSAMLRDLLVLSEVVVWLLCA